MCKINFCDALLYGKFLSLRNIFTFDGSAMVYKIKQDINK